jgi:hypothetical protein
MDSINCRNPYPHQPRVGALGQSQLALVHRIRRRQPFSIVSHALVLDGRHSEKSGRRPKRGPGFKRSKVMRLAMSPVSETGGIAAQKG